jgi:hypothetical protein
MANDIGAPAGLEESSHEHHERATLTETGTKR